MRALGPGSVSSFLKVILDVFYYVLLAVGVALGVAAIGVILISVRPDLLGSHIDIDKIHISGPMAAPAAFATVAALGLYVAGALVIVGRLRRIFRTLIAGDPFHPDNVRRLRVIGLTLAVLEIGRYGANGLSFLFLGGQTPLGGGVNLTTWFAVLVIFVLAEVFREGARLRREAQLTI
ncbi:MAG TPA: DUF2975 domain-containing protein [Caulobacteraceae bacterium]|nr:DUF2975 domain-containing protein [Caulobacteraceae bacterium]